MSVVSPRWWNLTTVSAFINCTSSKRSKKAAESEKMSLCNRINSHASSFLSKCRNSPQRSLIVPVEVNAVMVSKQNLKTSACNNIKARWRKKVWLLSSLHHSMYSLWTCWCSSGCRTSGRKCPPCPCPCPGRWCRCVWRRLLWSEGHTRHTDIWSQIAWWALPVWWHES